MTPVKKCPKCSFASEKSFGECPSCGVIVEKFLRYQERKREMASLETSGGESSPGVRFKDLFFNVEHDMNPLSFWGRILIFIVLLLWGIKLSFSSISSNYAGQSLLHFVNLPFHEAGHIVFRFFGRFITSLGGTLGQLLMPLCCMAVFILRTRDCFAGAVCLWWFGENFMDIAPYINDARAGVMPLVGGNTGQTSPYGFHDWQFLLTESGLLEYDHFLATLSHSTGVVLMLVSMLWAGYLLWKQYIYIKM